MDRRQMLCSAIEQPHRPDRAEEQHIPQLTQCDERHPQHGREVDVTPKEGERDGQTDQVVPPHDDACTEPLQLWLDQYRVGSDGDDGEEHEQVAVAATAVYEDETAIEDQEPRPDGDRPHTDNARAVEGGGSVEQPVDQQREGGAERGDDRRVDRSGVGGAPQDQIHPPIDDQNRDGQDV